MLNCSWVSCVPLRNEKAKRLNASRMALKKIYIYDLNSVFFLRWSGSLTYQADVLETGRRHEPLNQPLPTKTMTLCPFATNTTSKHDLNPTQRWSEWVWLGIWTLNVWMSSVLLRWTWQDPLFSRSGSCSQLCHGLVIVAMVYKIDKGDSCSFWVTYILF